MHVCIPYIGLKYLNAKVFIESWNKEIAIMLEEDAFFDGYKTIYMDPRQTELILIK